MLKKPFNRLRQLFNTAWQFVPSLVFPQLSCPYSQIFFIFIFFTADTQSHAGTLSLPSALKVTAAVVTQKLCFQVPSMSFLAAKNSQWLMPIGQWVQKTLTFSPRPFLSPITATSIYSLAETNLIFNPHSCITFQFSPASQHSWSQKKKKVLGSCSCNSSYTHYNPWPLLEPFPFFLTCHCLVYHTLPLALISTSKLHPFNLPLS